MERKEAIEIVRKLYNESLFMKKDKEAMVTLIPELRESEDEKIRKWIEIELESKYVVDNIVNNEMADKALAWLEKQGKNNMGISEATKKKLEDNLNKALEKETPESFNEFLDEQNPAWSEEDEAIYYGVIETEQYMLDVVNGVKEFSVGSISIKEECTRELNWLKSLKYRVLPQPRQEYDDMAYEMSRAVLYDKLKDSLHPKWKPSEEQMDILCKVSTYGVLSSSVRDVLQSLYNDLKKLKGRLTMLVALFLFSIIGIAAIGMLAWFADKKRNEKKGTDEVKK